MSARALFDTATHIHSVRPTSLWPDAWHAAVHHSICEDGRGLLLFPIISARAVHLRNDVYGVGGSGHPLKGCGFFFDDIKTADAAHVAGAARLAEIKRLENVRN